MPVSSRFQFGGCNFKYNSDGAGPPALFIQGTGVHGDAWLPQIDALKDAYRCISFDNRGMAQSQPRGAAITVPQMADDSVAILDHLGIERAHVVGHSLGGVVALQLALKAPERVKSLSLLCTFSRGRDAMQTAAHLLWTGLRTRIGSKRQRRRAFLELVLAPQELTGKDPDALAAQLAPVFGHDLADQPTAALQQMKALAAFDGTSRLNTLAQIPTLVVSAEFDRISPPWIGRAIAAGIPGARYEQVAGAGHGVPLMHAREINTLLREHFVRND